MRAVRSLGGTVAVVDTEPAAPGPWPMVHVAAAGICGSDLHLVDAGPSEITLGHEFAGWLDDGTPVAVLPHVACGSCRDCTVGNPQRCRREVGFLGVSLDGGMADRVRVPAGCLHPLPPGLSPADACLAEPLAVALHGLHRAGIEGAARVLVVGAGPIGLAAVAGALDCGARVDISEKRPDRRARAVALGAGDDPGSDYDVVIDAAGTEASLRFATRRCAPGGTIGLLATHWSPVPIGVDLQLREVSLVPAYLYGHHRGRHEFDLALDLLTRSPLAEIVVSHRMGLDEAARAFHVAAADPAACKVVLEPR